MKKYYEKHSCLDYEIEKRLNQFVSNGWKLENIISHITDIRDNKNQIEYVFIVSRKKKWRF